MKITFILLSCLLFSVWLSACGNKGELTLDQNEHIERDLDRVKDNLEEVEEALMAPPGADEPTDSTPDESDADAASKQKKKPVPAAD